MFIFFANLAITIYYGVWCTADFDLYVTGFIAYMKKVPIFGLFNNSSEAFYNTTDYFYLDFVDGISRQVPGLAITIATILSAICCIGVFFIIVKSVKKLFSCFLGE